MGATNEAVDEWLERRGARPVTEDEWQQQFTALLDRRAPMASKSERTASINGPVCSICGPLGATSAFLRSGMRT